MSTVLTSGNTKTSSSSINGHHNESISTTITTTTTTTTTDLGWCQYIPWDSYFVTRILPDPTRIFVIVCCSIMYIRFVLAHDNDYWLGIQQSLLNPYVLFFVSSAQITYWLGQKKRSSNNSRNNSSSSSSSSNTVSQQQQQQQQQRPTLLLPIYESWIIEWYYWNGCLFHAIMDGSSGSLRLVPVVVHQYDILDTRFPLHHTVPYMIGMIELLVMYPLCLLTMYYILVDTKHPYRFPLELITSTLHIMGMIVFVFTEVYDGQCHIPALDPVGSNCYNSNTNDHTLHFQFLNIYHLTYYWFGFWFCNMIWGIVPLYRILRSVQECHRAFTVMNTNHPNNDNNKKDM